MKGKEKGSANKMLNMIPKYALYEVTDGKIYQEMKQHML